MYQKDNSRQGMHRILSTDHADEKLADSVKKRYTTQRTLDNGFNVTFRPIECTDHAEFKEFFKALSPASVHFRFLEIIRFLQRNRREILRFRLQPRDGNSCPA